MKTSQHRVTRFALFLAHQLSHMVRADWTVKANFVIRLDCAAHIGWPIVVERLCKTFSGTTYVSKVDVIDAWTESADFFDVMFLTDERLWGCEPKIFFAGC